MKQELIKQLLEARKNLLKELDLMNDEVKVGEWTKKEIVAHIAGWDVDGVDGLPKILKGEKPNSFRKSINGYNRQSVENRKNKSIQQILQEMHQLREKLIRQISALKEDQITSYYGTTLGKKPINLLWMINEAITHDIDHAKQLEKFR